MQALIHFDDYLESFIQKKNQLIKAINYQQPHLTYGEIKFQSLLKLLAFIDWRPDDIFCDFGSGYGKVLWHVALHAQIKQIIGIEYARNRHQVAKELYLSLVNDANFPYKEHCNVRLYKDDFLTSPLVSKATIIYAASTCFGHELMSGISVLVDTLPKLRLICSFRPLCGLINFNMIKRIHIECSWDSAFCYFYRKK